MRVQGVGLLLLLATLVGGCSRGAAGVEAWARQTHANLSLRAHAAQVVVGVLKDLRPRSPSELDTALARLQAQLRRDSLGGVIVRGVDSHVAVRTVAALREAAPLPILIGGYLDRGLASSVEGATEFPLVWAVGARAEGDVMRRAGRLVAREANAVGVDLAFLRGSRGSPSHPWAVDPSLASEYLRGLADGGLLPVWPAFSPAVDTAGDLHVASWDRAWLEGGELAALRDALEAGAAGILMPGIALPALTGDTVPLPFASTVVRGLLRRDLDFAGLVGVELNGALVERYGAGNAAVRAVAAGADLLIGVTDPGEVIDALVTAVEDGHLPRARLEDASLRVLQAKATRGLHRRGIVPRRDLRRELRRADAERLAGELFEQSTLVLGAHGPDIDRSEAPAVLLTRRGEGAVLASALTQVYPGLRHLQIDSVDEGRLDTLVGAAQLLFYAESPRASGSLGELLTGPGAPVHSGLITVEFRFLDDSGPSLPTAPAAVLSPGSGAEAQRAAVRALVAHGAAPEPASGGPRWPPARILQTAPAAEAGMSEAALARVDVLLRQAIADGLFPGAAVAVGRRGKLVRLRGYGHLSREPDAAAVHPETTLYDLASLTKVVASTAAAKVLVGEGRLELDAPLTRYLPEWTAAGAFAASDNGVRGRVTVRQLLAHTAGLPAGLAIHAYADSPQQARQRVVGAPIVLEPGAVALYSDVGLIVLGELLERVAGEPFDVFLARSVFRPLGMESTMYLPPLGLRGRAAPTAQTAPDEFELHGIVHDGTAFRLGGVAGHAGLFSTARDLAVYAQTLLNDGAYGVRQVFAPATVAAFRARQPGAQERALGWDTPAPESSAGSYFSENSFGHTGFTGTSLWIDPEKDLFVVLLTNRTYDRTSLLRMLELRQRLHDAVAQSIVDAPVRRRPGAVDPIRLPGARARR